MYTILGLKLFLIFISLLFKYIFTSQKLSWVGSCSDVTTPFISLSIRLFFNLFTSLSTGFSSIPLPGASLNFILHFFFLSLAMLDQNTLHKSEPQGRLYTRLFLRLPFSMQLI